MQSQIGLSQSHRILWNLGDPWELSYLEARGLTFYTDQPWDRGWPPQRGMTLSKVAIWGKGQSWERIQLGPVGHQHSQQHGDGGVNLKGRIWAVFPTIYHNALPIGWLSHSLHLWGVNLSGLTEQIKKKKRKQTCFERIIIRIFFKRAAL